MPRIPRAAVGALTAAAVLVAPAAASAAPTVSITGPFGNGHVYASGSVSYNFAATDDGTPFVTCTLDQPTSADIVTNSCSSPAAYAGLTDEGLYTLTVTDDNGVDPPASDSVTFYVDQTTPTGTIGSGPSGLTNSDPGNANYGFSVSDTGSPLTITCAFTRPDATTDGPDPCTNSASYPTNGAGQGTYTFSVVATDGAGHVLSLSRSFTLDTTGPAFSPDPDFTPQPTGGITSSSNPQFTWAATDLHGPVTFTCKVNGGSANPCSSGDTFAYLDGTGRTLDVIAADAAGNTTTKTKTFTVDTTKPTFTTPPTLSPEPQAGSGVTSSSQPTFTWATSDLTSVTYTCAVDNVSVGACTSGYQTVVLADGSHSLDVFATDAAGNVRQSTASFVVDTTPPSFTTNLTMTPEPAAGYTNTLTPTFTWASSDITTQTYTCRVNGGSPFACSSGYQPTYTNGAARTFSVTAKDQANHTTTQTKTFIVDTINPTVDTFDVTPHGHTVIDTRSRTPHFTFTGHDVNTPLTFQCSIDGASYDPCTNTGTTGVYDAPSPLQEGHHVLHVKATDQATNTSTTDFDFYVDVTNPTPSTNIPDGTDLVMHQVKTVVCNDFPGDNVYVSGVYTCVATIDGSPFGVGGAVPTHSDDLGYHTVDVTATDEAGNVQSTNNGGPHAHYVVNAGPYKDVLNGFGPAGFWQGADGAISTTMADSSNHGIDGKWTPGVAHLRSGPAVDMTVNAGATATELSGTGGSYGYVSGIDAGPHGYTMDIWVKPLDTDQQSVYGHGAGAGEIFIDSSGKFAFHHPGVTIEASGTTIVPGRWYHLMATWSRTSSFNPGTVTLRVEGFDGSMSSLGTETQTGASTQDASGAAALYIGNGELGNNKTFHGFVADAAYFTRALGSHEFVDLSKAMTWTYHPIRANLTDWTPPTISITSPLDGDGFQTSKAPNTHYAWSCDDFEGAGDVTACTATVDGSPVSQGGPLTSATGPHTLTVTASDDQGSTTKSVTFTVGSYSSVIAQDSPVAYWRLNEDNNATTMADASGNGHAGGYKWDASASANGGPGISGDGDTTREFFGNGAYAYVNNLAVSNVGLTEEAWVEVADPARDQVFMEHGGAGMLYVRGGLYRFKPNANHTIELTGPAPSNGSFDQVVGTWDGVNATLYVNGVAVAGAMSIDPPPSGVATFYLGRTDSGLGAFHGTLDEAAYYDHALSAHRVLLHYKADPPAGAAAAAPKSAAPAPTSSAHSKSKKPSAKAKAAAKKARVKALTRSLAKARAKLKVLVRHHAATRRIAAQRKRVAHVAHQLRLAKR